MEHVVTVTYDRKLIRRAMNWFVFHQPWAVLKICIWVSILIAITHDSLDLYGMPDDIEIALGLLKILSLVTILVLVTHKWFWRYECDGKTVVFKFSDNGVTVDLPEVVSEFEWPLFNKVVKLKDAWLLVYAKSRYLMLPTSSLTPECMQLIEEKIGEAKRKDAV